MAERNGGNTAREQGALEITRRWDAPPERVWQAWTDPQALSRWFGTGDPGCVTQAEIDLRVGGRYRIVTKRPDGQTNDVSGEYQEVVPHSRLAFSWAWQSTPERVSHVSIDFIASGGGTVLRFVHDRFFDDQARINHERGWLKLFGQLDAFFQPGTREI
jgi:uncharacterized protein YndB with AHSA1/START domain